MKCVHHRGEDHGHLTARPLDRRLPSFPGGWHSSDPLKLPHPGRVQGIPGSYKFKVFFVVVIVDDKEIDTPTTDKTIGP